MKGIFKEKTRVSHSKAKGMSKIVCMLLIGVLSGCAGSPASEGAGVWGLVVPRKKVDVDASKIEKEKKERERIEREELLNTNSPYTSEIQRIFSDRPWG